MEQFRVVKVCPRYLTLSFTTSISSPLISPFHLFLYSHRFLIPLFESFWRSRPTYVMHVLLKCPQHIFQCFRTVGNNGDIISILQCSNLDTANRNSTLFSFDPFHVDVINGPSINFYLFSGITYFIV